MRFLIESQMQLIVLFHFSTKLLYFSFNWLRLFCQIGGGRVAIIEETIKTMMTEETITVMMIDEAIIIMMENTNRIAANLPVPRKTQKILIQAMRRPPWGLWLQLLDYQNLINNPPPEMSSLSVTCLETLETWQFTTSYFK